ncbi:hypothetical protein GCM10009786_05120 [Leucobacter alluvii]|uniref:Uncharacterized protein n=1 Tax=Leucobacter alluvii TaxID=340321 RepID=A0ABN3B3K4_9MICO
MSTATATTNIIVTHACGHAHARDLSDTAASLRSDKAKWWATQECKPCNAETFAARQRAKPVSAEVKAARAARLQTALDDAQRMNLPPLQGSEKQIPYGTELRYDALRLLYEELVQSERMTEDEYDEKVTTLARRINRAKFWIEHKESSVDDFLLDLADPGDQNIGTENPY